jgi:hypothetical protein
LFQYKIAALLIISEIALQKIREEKEFQNGKHDKKFYKDDNPNLPAPFAHILKSVEIEIPNTDNDIFGFFAHSLKLHF